MMQRGGVFLGILAISSVGMLPFVSMQALAMLRDVAEIKAHPDGKIELLCAWSRRSIIAQEIR